MDTINDNLIGVILIFIAIALFSFAIRFKKLTVLEDGDNVSPAYYKMLQLFGVLAAAVIFIWQFDIITDVFLHSVMSFTSSSDAKMCVIIMLAVGIVLYIVFKKLGIYLRHELALQRVKKCLLDDVIVNKLLADVKNGARQICIYQNRCESTKSYDFDIAGYNHPAFSAEGAYLVGAYINKENDKCFRLNVVKAYAGEGRSSQLNVLNNGTRYKFSHVHLQR